MEDRFGYVRLRGELSGVKRAASGHLYCALKDDKAVIDGVMWKGNAQRLSFRPEDGIEVVATGQAHHLSRPFQIPDRDRQHGDRGRGRAAGAAGKDHGSGWRRKGCSPPNASSACRSCRRIIGVVTSPTGAVIRDILHRLADRFPSHVLVWPVLVQGQGAASRLPRRFAAFPTSRPAARCRGPTW